MGFNSGFKGLISNIEAHASNSREQWSLLSSLFQADVQYCSFYIRWALTSS